MWGHVDQAEGNEESVFSPRDMTGLQEVLQICDRQ
jgi:hypothetical protein